MASLPPANDIPVAFTASLRSWYVPVLLIHPFLIVAGGMQAKSRVPSARSVSSDDSPSIIHHLHPLRPLQDPSQPPSLKSPSAILHTTSTPWRSLPLTQATPARRHRPFSCMAMAPASASSSTTFLSLVPGPLSDRLPSTLSTGSEWAVLPALLSR